MNNTSQRIQAACLLLQNHMQNRENLRARGRATDIIQEVMAVKEAELVANVQKEMDADDKRLDQELVTAEYVTALRAEFQAHSDAQNRTIADREAAISYNIKTIGEQADLIKQLRNDNSRLIAENKRLKQFEPKG